MHDIDLDIEGGECLGLVGDSGSGKTTLGRTLLRFMSRRRARSISPGKTSLIFPSATCGRFARHRTEDILAQLLLAFGRVKNRDEGRVQALTLLNRIGPPSAFARRFPHQLSGGQRQRVGIARAIAFRPQFIVAEEIVSGLDVFPPRLRFSRCCGNSNRRTTRR